MSVRRALSIVAAAVLVTAVVTSCGGKAKAPSQPIVTGVVGPGATISLRDASGKTITKLKPGLYRFKIMDRSTVDDFHLVGPTVDLRTRLKGVGVSGWSLTMNPGKYRFYSDSHPATLAGSFSVK